MTPAALCAAARVMLAERRDAWTGLWPRAVAFLARQALEAEVSQQLARRLPGLEDATRTTQLVCLREVHPDRALAARIAWTWSALSQACHHHGYALPPTHAELATWLSTVETLIASRENTRRSRSLD